MKLGDLIVWVMLIECIIAMIGYYLTKDYPKALYFLGGVLINTAVLWMK